MSDPESVVGQWWSEGDGSVGSPPETPIHEVLKWIVIQLHRGNFRLEAEDNGRLDTLVIGRDAAPWRTGEQFVESERNRDLALAVARIFADAREGGIEPEYAEVSEEARFTANDNGFMNTDLHYALELVKVLGGIRRRTFELVTLPLVGKASAELRRLLREATRSHLFGLHRACAALCRAVLERGLSERVPGAEVTAERAKRPKSGELECMIDVAGRHSLDRNLVGMAHAVRITGNKIIHSEASDGIEDSFVVLSDTRLIVERLFAQA